MLRLIANTKADGYHIAALMVGNLYAINPLILEQERVYIANPPLYVLAFNKSVKVRNMTTRLFLRDHTALLDTKIRKLYQNALKIKIKNLSNDKVMNLTPDKYRDFCYYVDHVGRIIESVADTLVMDPSILMLLTNCIEYLTGKIQTNKIKKYICADNVIYQQASNTLIIDDGGIEYTIPLTNLVKEICQHILPEIDMLRWKDITYLVSTIQTNTFKNKPMTLYQIYWYFKELEKVFTIHRLKGLGEMDDADLEITCVNPLTRSCSQITSIGDVDYIYDLLGVKTDARKQLIMGAPHAYEVESK